MHALGVEKLTSHIVLLPREHDLRRAIVPRRDVTRHLRVLQPREPEIADLEVAVLVDENVGRLEVAVDDAGRVRVFQAALMEGQRTAAKYEGRSTRLADVLLLETLVSLSDRRRPYKGAQMGRTAEAGWLGAA